MLSRKGSRCFGVFAGPARAAPPVSAHTALLRDREVTTGVEDIALRIYVAEGRGRDVAALYHRDASCRAFLDSVLPDGACKPFTKNWSYDGAYTVARWRVSSPGSYHDVYTGLHFRDLGHWACGVVGYLLAECLGSSSRLRYRLCDSSPLIDRAVGDMFEATLGYCWRREASTEHAPAWVLEVKTTLEEFAWSVCRCRTGLSSPPKTRELAWLMSL